MKSISLYIIFSFTILILQSNNLYAQQSAEFDYYFQDTIPGDTIRKSNIQKSDQFYDSLRSKAENNKWTRKLFDAIIVTDSKGKEVRSKRSVEEYYKYEGKIIRNIDFIRLNPFGTSLWDTTHYKENWLNNTGNAIHFRTNRKVLDRQLIIKPGEEINPYTLADNERIIRALPYIEDVRIMLVQADDDPGYVDVVFITKDVWSGAFYPEIKDVDAGKIELWDSNIFGSGNEFQNNIHWDKSKTGTWGYEAFLKNRNILGSFIDSRFYYQKIYERKSIGFNFERKFFTPNTKYAGGFSGNSIGDYLNVWYYDTAYVAEYIDQSTTNFWVGRAFLLRNKNILSGMRRNIIIASGLFYDNFQNRPAVDTKYLHEFHNRMLWLNYVAITAQNFYRTSLIYNFGRTEDIPSGYLAKYTFGKEFGEFENRNYQAIELAAGSYVFNAGYFHLSTILGGYITDEKELQQGIFKVQGDYFTNLFISGRFKFRHFASVNFTRGINRFPTERLNLNERYGLTGINKAEINGKQKLVLNLQTVSFTPYLIYGFRFAFFGFTDIGFLGAERIKITEFKPYSAFGLGVRIRNERLIFPTFQLRFAVFTNIPDLDLGDYVHFQSEEKLNPRSFYTDAPAPVSFR